MPLIPRSRNVSESSTVSAKEDEEESSDEADKKSSPNPAQTEKLGDVKENTKVAVLSCCHHSPHPQLGGRAGNLGFGRASDNPPSDWGRLIYSAGGAHHRP